MVLLHLNNANARSAAVSAIWDAPDGYVCQILPAKRTSPQNAILHAALTDISEQVEWHGQKLEIEDWKRLLTAAWCRATHQYVRLMPAIDGQGYDVLYRRTSKMTKPELSELLEYLFAWGTDQGVRFKDTRYE